MTYNHFFENAIIYPDSEIQERLNKLIGLEHHKDILTKTISLLINQKQFKEWVEKYYSKSAFIFNAISERPPLIILEGDVGTGKSELAMTIGDSVARLNKIEVKLFPLSLSTRGQGRVGEMTKLISEAFSYTIEVGQKLKNKNGTSRGGIILLVDEADALTQSRESTQMHHEDKAGVNAFIRGIDRIGHNKLPIVVIMCTNRMGSLDPAIKRRASNILTFNRPNRIQRKAVLTPILQELNFSELDINEIVALTGKSNDRNYGFTYSDINQRLIPIIILDAFPNNAVDSKKAITLIQSIKPTPPFIDKP